jgi:hypothetical protein
MGSTRRSVLTSSLAASAFAWGDLSVPTNAAPGQFKLKFGSDSPEGSPVTFHMREVAKKVQEPPPVRSRSASSRTVSWDRAPTCSRR